MSLTDLSSIKPDDVQFEYHAPQHTTGIGSRRPRLSWKLPQAPAHYQQQASELAITLTHADGRCEQLTYTLSGPQQILLPWPGPDLQSRDRITLRVRVSDGASWSAWSDTACAETGLLDETEWQAKMIHSAIPEDRFREGRVFQLRKSFTLHQPVVRARLYLSALGLAEVEINGHKVGEDALLPGWTSYHHRLRYFTYDVTGLLSAGGEQAIGAWLADGWYSGRIGFHGGNARLYGDRSGLLAQLEILHSDGSQSLIVSDDSWRCQPAPILSADLYNGETFDATRYNTRWSTAGFNDADWFRVQEAEYFNYARLVAPDGPPVRAQHRLTPVEIVRQPDGNWLLDFGQNLSGRLSIRVSGRRGQQIVLRHAEVLQEGKLYRRTLRGAASEDRYIIGEDSVTESWEPRFTIHGFRYAEVEGWPGENLDPEDITARVYYSAMPETGHFSCSDAGINQLHSNVQWSMRSNFVDLPTDCPQRDERLGWTGDIQVFTPTATFLNDVRGFLASWLKDLAAEQREFGNVPWYVPWIPGNAWSIAEAGSVWGDVATITPWVLYQRYKDPGILHQQYDSAKMWCDRLIAKFAPGEHRVSADMQLGDWLDPQAPPDNPIEAMTDPELIATAYAFKSLQIMAQMAKITGRPAQAEYYAQVAERVQQDFLSHWFPAGNAGSNNTQCAWSIALVFGLIREPAERQAAGERLAALIRDNRGRIGTGFAGTPLVLDALTQTGHLGEAWQMLLCRECPSWLYQVDMGATTIWERWDSMQPDGTVNSGEMTSFNHYALGAVADWLHRVVGGIENAGSGYDRILFRPRPGGGVSHAKCELASPYGRIASGWQITDGTFSVTVEVPPGAGAELVMPDGTRHTLTNGEHRYACRWAADR